MLTYSDEPIIRRALLKRLELFPGGKILDIKVVAHKDWIAVGVEWMLHDKIHGTSTFHLPSHFELSQVHNEADEIYEQFKEAKAKMLFTGSMIPDLGAISERHTAKGNGLRGNWRKHGERTH